MHLSPGLRRLVATLGISLAAIVPASASTLILDNYTRSGPSESLVAPFTSPAWSTANSYSGFVEVLVSGTGYSLWDIINDAFYFVGSATADFEYYQLNIGPVGGVGLVGLSGDSYNINNFIVFDQGVGTVSPGYTPAFNANNTYHFVVDTALMGLSGPQNLQFGVSDGVFEDNGGEYRISVWQLESGGRVPESPAPYTLMGLVFVFALSRWRRRA